MTIKPLASERQKQNDVGANNVVARLGASSDAVRAVQTGTKAMRLLAQRGKWHEADMFAASTRMLDGSYRPFGSVPIDPSGYRLSAGRMSMI